MATIRKSFNLRNGVQVDNDNFIVTANGRVGIGTSTPTQLLDVYGGTIQTNSGIIANNLSVVNSNVTGISTVNLLNTQTYVNVGVTSITSGIITSYTGIVTYYGDGGSLLNLPTSQWLDVDVGLGFTSIYAQGYVGVGTVDPRYLFQVGGNNNIGVFTNGVGIDNVGNIRATGIITASQFSGNGSLLTGINATNLSTGTVSNSLLPQNISVSGIITAQTFRGSLVGIADTANDVSSSSNITLSGLTVTGVSTASTLLNVNGSIGVGNLNTNADVHIRRSGISSLRLTSDGSFPSIITIGRNATSSFLNNSQIRYGNTDGLYARSTEQSLDFINFGNGNINYYNNAGVVGPSGNYYWHSGTSNVRMTLTADGKLGVKIDNPVNELHIVGTSTVTQDSYIAGNISVIGNGTIGGSLTVNQINASGQSIIQNRVGITTNNPQYTLQIGSSPLSSGGGVGIGSDGNVAIRNDLATVRNINSSGIITSTTLDVNGNAEVGGSIAIASSVTSNSVYANNLHGNGSQITNLDLNNVTNGTIDGSNLDVNININTIGIITAASFSSGLGRVAISTDNPGDGVRVYFTDPVSGLSTSFGLY